MHLGSRITYLLPNDIENVPADKVGVYSFSLLFPNDYQLGLMANNIDLERAKFLLKNRLNRYRQAFETVQFIGEIESVVHGNHLKKRYSLVANLDQKSHLEDMVEEYFGAEGLSLNTIKALTEVLRRSFLFSTPLYIGMTANQSFRTRLDQHVNNQSNFSNILKKQGITWAETKFECVPMFGVTPGGINSIERIVQNLFKPSYCLG